MSGEIEHTMFFCLDTEIPGFMCQFGCPCLSQHISRAS